ncbi:hypothetical protein D3P08_25800 [Paenibacillus nanensis]|uniref:Uncharacterized protein n=1 Tax=Paenibacillus nanensis TaxID=393251 RepID=A0A3A1UK60_9BACL|nr:hypothetical protein [Paenibacillus nanensis]RIX47078.1 hypothetical protein D3P08_25800 [Paenibacillus nanensis]
MLRTKIVVCALLCLVLVAAGAILHNGMKKERYPYYTRQVVTEGEYRIYNDVEPNTARYSFTPYLPREYIRIIELADVNKAD